MHTGKKELSERVHHCYECGYITDRDVAALIVIRATWSYSRWTNGSAVPVEVNRLGVLVKYESLESNLGKGAL